MAQSARSAALTVLEKCRRNGAWSDAVLDSVITAAGLSGRDAALCTKLCTGVLQNFALCDFYIDCYSSTRSHRLEPKLRDILRLSVYQLAFLDRIPPHAAVSEGVLLAKHHNPKTAGLTNAVLRRVAENRGKLPEIPGAGTARYLAIRYSHPMWLCEMLMAESGYDFTRAFLEANNTEPPATAQVNTLKTTTPELLAILGREGIEAREGSNPLSLALHAPGDLKKLESFQKGLFYIQDDAARRAVLTAGPKPGMRVLDACAAPGGKSFAAAIATENCGEIIACDSHEEKLSRIVSGARRLGVTIITARAMDAREPDERFYEAFDLVLADVPCSGIGVIRKKPDIRTRPEEDAARLPDVQLQILRGLAKTVKPAGALLYSTCTVLRRENEGVVARFLEENTGFEVEGEMQTLFPHIDGTDGFFICKLRKKA
ncbi:MAG: 16S rRNA (cytosine(967)-C(5))-methyltransferase RsmB [Oscillospiraceae bacterium]